MARGIAPMMVEQGHGKIINISMNYETMRRRGFVQYGYGPSRAGVESPSYIMADPIVFLASDGITGERIVATEFAEWCAGRVGGES
ncbi:SDR family oxidoreductase [Alicyclobacillus cycloheptanicus]|uniref:NAD(P)-dependent dehydrogenase (Short-subunit alcohol dehydrogenase family) n=1 Tax=Alicyclobacillus cycloheptanicus TaxID=1457 RepID=A0ABT9XMA4_9BACL|nr:hypothetical protein [Alicyclobacillus cycloheptanicus]MDQ0191451.1 NAD(P)-dependent dehydrogenase (short-subunit alcohol dehydrogenase family) [Alicyclobacillus cycloheptanicus]